MPFFVTFFLQVSAFLSSVAWKRVGVWSKSQHCFPWNNALKLLEQRGSVLSKKRVSTVAACVFVSVKPVRVCVCIHNGLHLALFLSPVSLLSLSGHSFFPWLSSHCLRRERTRCTSSTSWAALRCADKRRGNTKTGGGRVTVYYSLVKGESESQHGRPVVRDGRPGRGQGGRSAAITNTTGCSSSTTTTVFSSDELGMHHPCPPSFG